MVVRGCSSCRFVYKTESKVMSYQFSSFGQHLGCGSGIEELMDDLGHALASGGPDLKML
jgi:hypothetical protein